VNKRTSGAGAAGVWSVDIVVEGKRITGSVVRVGVQGCFLVVLLALSDIAEIGASIDVLFHYEPL